MKRALLLVCLVACALACLGLAIAVYPTFAEPGLPLSSAKASLAMSAGTRPSALAPLGATPTPGGCVVYNCSVTPGATIVPGTTDTGNHTDDGVTNISLPFPFALYGTAYTNVNLSSNGNAQLVSGDPEFTNTCLPVSTLGPTIYAYWEDLVTDGTKCTGGCGIYTSISGSAPNRIFNIEWRTFYFSEPGNAYFEIRLYEATSSFEVIVGQINTDATATIGVQDGAGAFTQCLCNTQGPANSRIVFTASTGSCPTPTNTPTGTLPTATRTNTPGSTPIPTNTSPPSGTATPSRTATGVASGTAIPTTTVTATNPATGTITPTATPAGNTSPTPTCTISFSDVQPADYFYAPVRYMYCAGIISGYGDNTFRPFNDTTRGQLTKIVVLARGWALYCPASRTFSDVAPGSAFYCFVETAYQHGIIAGYGDGTFRPNNSVTRGQLSKIIVQAMGWTDSCPSGGHFSDVLPGSPFFCFVETALSHGIISGYIDGTFRPGNTATRGQISKIVYLAVTGP